MCSLPSFKCVKHDLQQNFPISVFQTCPLFLSVHVLLYYTIKFLLVLLAVMHIEVGSYQYLFYCFGTAQQLLTGLKDYNLDG